MALSLRAARALEVMRDRRFAYPASNARDGWIRLAGEPNIGPRTIEELLIAGEIDARYPTGRATTNNWYRLRHRPILLADDSGDFGDLWVE